MIVEVQYSASDLAKRCYGCAFLNLTYADYSGNCTHPKIRNQYRSVLDRACSNKQIKRDTDDGDSDE